MTGPGARGAIEILLVEDSPTDRLIAIEALQQSRIINNLNIVENGVEAMNYLRREGKFAAAKRPDLILLDLNLPKKDGREVLMEVKHDPSLKYIPVIVLTTSGADEDVARAYGNHANSFITKPVDFPRFTQALEAIEKYWFEVVTLPPVEMLERLTRFDKPVPSSSGSLRRKLGLVLISEDAHKLRELRELVSQPGNEHLTLSHVEALEGLREALEGLPADVLLVDLAVPGAAGLEAYRRARTLAPGAAIVALVEDEAAGESALREGVEDYLELGELSPSMLLRALRHARSQKHLRDELRRAQRLEAVGQIASGIAHDFNNLLTVLHGHAELLSDLGQSASIGDSVQGIKDASERAGQLTRQLLAFSQRQALQIRPVDLNRVVNDFSKMLRRVLGRDVRLELRLSPQAPSALADIGLMEQVLLGLALNARDAMPGGGELVLETSSGTIDKRALPHPDAYAGSFAILTVRDTSVGVPSEFQPRVEDILAAPEPRGTALGLSAVQGIVQQHRGWIQLASKPGLGTSYQIFLPSAQPVREAAAAPVSRGGTENILLVDDESPVRQMAKAILGRQGYQVLEARSGPDAITTFEESPRRIDLLLTDVVMPGGMTGRELADELQRRDPALKVVFTSGYGREQAVAGLALNEDAEFLAKPYVSSRLLGAVRRALDGTLESREPDFAGASNQRAPLGGRA